MKQLSEDKCGINTSVLRSLITTLLITQVLAVSQTEFFSVRILYNALDLKLEFRPQQAPIPISQIPRDVLDQAEMNYQDVRRKAMQAYIKYEAYYDTKKANAS